MTSPKNGFAYSAIAIWDGRAETPTELADRWIAMIARLQAIDPFLSRWYDRSSGMLVPFNPEKMRVADLIASGIGHEDNGKPQPLYGYQCWAYNSSEDRRGPRSLTAHMLAGSGGPVGTNNVSLWTDYGIIPDPGLINFEIFRGAVLALAECFDAAIAYACSDSLTDLWPKYRRWQPTLRLAWISYLGPRFAPLVTPPSSAVVEYRPNGGLLMAATTETFVTANPKHLAVARDIEAAAAPFNRLSWPLETAR